MAQQYTIQKGDTLSNIALKYGSSVQELMKMNPDIKDANKIYAGYAMNLPGEKSTSQLAPATISTTTGTSTTGTQTTSSTAGGTQALPGTMSGTGSGMSASFLSNYLNDLDALNQSLPSTDTDLFETSRALSEAQIQSQYGSALDTLQSSKKEGQKAIAKGLDLLQLSPSVARYQVEQYDTMVSKYSTDIDKQIANLEKEEANALASNNLNYVQQIQQAKMDAWNSQRQMITDKYNVITQAFNMMLSGEQMDMQREQNAQSTAKANLENIIGAYAGSGATMTTLPEGTRNQLLQSAQTLGLTADVLDRMLIGQADVQIVTDSSSGLTMAIDKNTGKVMWSQRTGSGTSSQNVFGALRALSSEVGTNLNSVVGTDGKVDVVDYYTELDYWKQLAPQYVKQFFQAYPTKQYLSDSESDPNRRKYIDIIKAQEEQYLKSSEVTLTMLANQMGFTPTSTQQ